MDPLSNETLRSDLDRPAILTLWPDCPMTKAVEPRSVATLREALREAGEALRAGRASPWIETDSGLLLGPGVLETLSGPRDPEGGPAAV